MITLSGFHCTRILIKSRIITAEALIKFLDDFTDPNFPTNRDKNENMNTNELKLLSECNDQQVNESQLSNNSFPIPVFNEKDKLYVFSFWATWCSPCIQELEAINEVYEDWKNQLNIEVIAVATDDSRTQKRVKPLVNGKGWNYTILLDANQDLKRKLSIANIPYLIIVKNNKIVFIVC
jgi:thiol-disulfide isomerase/thioredoxin